MKDLRPCFAVVGHLQQVYWWQRMGVYLVGSYGPEGVLKPLGQFFALDAAVAAALPNHPPREGR